MAFWDCTATNKERVLHFTVWERLPLLNPSFICKGTHSRATGALRPAVSENWLSLQPIIERRHSSRKNHRSQNRC